MWLTSQRLPGECLPISDAFSTTLAWQRPLGAAHQTTVRLGRVRTMPGVPIDSSKCRNEIRIAGTRLSRPFISELQIGKEGHVHWPDKGACDSDGSAELPEGKLGTTFGDL
jgi:hypothetical protein